MSRNRSKKTSNKRKKKNNYGSGKALNENVKKSPINKNRRLFLSAIGVAVLSGGYFIYKKNNPVLQSLKKQSPATDLASLKGHETRSVLSPGLFFGKTSRAYNTAQENRELLDHMYCYCNCKKTIGHKSLLSCFADRHAENCDICQDEAFYAATEFKKNNDILQVRVAVDKKFWRPLR